MYIRTKNLVIGTPAVCPRNFQLNPTIAGKPVIAKIQERSFERGIFVDVFTKSKYAISPDRDWDSPLCLINIHPIFTNKKFISKAFLKKISLLLHDSNDIEKVQQLIEKH